MRGDHNIRNVCEGPLVDWLMDAMDGVAAAKATLGPFVLVLPGDHRYWSLSPEGRERLRREVGADRVIRRNDCIRAEPPLLLSDVPVI